VLPTAIPKLGRYFLSVWDRFFATELGKSLASQTIWKLGAAPRAKEQPDFTTAAIENLYADLSEFGRVDQRNFGLIERALHLRTTRDARIHISISLPGTADFIISPLSGSADPRCCPSNKEVTSLSRPPLGQLPNRSGTRRQAPCVLESNTTSRTCTSPMQVIGVLPTKFHNPFLTESSADSGSYKIE
jgi:hypothetical protein